MNARRRFIGKTLAVGSGLALLSGCKFDHSDKESTGSKVQDRDDFDASLPKPCNPISWVKKGVVIEPDFADGARFIQNFNSPAEFLGNNRWRIWHGINPPKPGTPTICYSEGVPGGKMVTYRADLSENEPIVSDLSIGNLPKGWNPVQPVHIKLNDGNHRLYFWAHDPSQRIVRLLVADSKNGKHYRVIDPYRPCMYHFRDRAVDFKGVTPSGLKLMGKSDEEKRRFPKPDNEPSAQPELICNDGTTVYQLDDGTFEMYVISLVSLEPGDPRWASNDNLAGYIRVIDRLASKDGLNWSGRQTVVEPDFEFDPIDQQFYYLNVTHTPKGRVGMLGHYSAKDQTMDVEWCFSNDGVHWERPYRNRPWIARGWPGEPDSLSIYPGTSLVYTEDRWFLFYTGCNYTHNRAHHYGEPKSVIMLAETPSIWKE